MFRKTLVATLTVAIVASSAITAPTTASAANGRSFAASVALAAGVALAAAVTSSNDRSNRSGCFQRPIETRDYRGNRVIHSKWSCN